MLVLLPLVVLYISVHMFCECMFIINVCVCVCVCVHVCKRYANNLDWRVLNSIEGKHSTYYHETYDFHHPLSLPLVAPARLPHDPLWHSERRKHMFCCSTIHAEPHLYGITHSTCVHVQATFTCVRTCTCTAYELLLTCMEGFCVQTGQGNCEILESDKARITIGQVFDHIFTLSTVF